MTTKHTLVKDTTVENFRKEVRGLLAHGVIMQLYAKNVHTHRLYDDVAIRQIKGAAESLQVKMMRFIDLLKNTLPATPVEKAVLRQITKDIDPDKDQVCNIANMTEIILESNEDYTDRVNFVTSHDWRKEIAARYRKSICKEFFMAGGGSAADFEAYYATTEVRSKN